MMNIMSQNAAVQKLHEATSSITWYGRYTGHPARVRVTIIVYHMHAMAVYSSYAYKPGAAGRGGMPYTDGCLVPCREKPCG